jgi:tripeptidyl-peptidase I
MALLEALWLTLLVGLLPGLSKAVAEKHVFEKRDTALPFDWLESHEPSPNLVLTVRIGLKQKNIDRLEEFLTSVSHPQSIQYGQHWSLEQVARTFAPAPDTIDVVRDWLVSAGIPGERQSLTPSQGWIHFNATVVEVEKLLDSKYMIYRHGSGVEHIGEQFKTESLHYSYQASQWLH